MYDLSFLCIAGILKFEEINANPWLSIVSSESVITPLPVPIDQVIIGIGIPLAVQLKTIMSPSSISRTTPLDGSAMTADPI